MPAIITRGAASAKAFGWSSGAAPDPLIAFTDFYAPAAITGDSGGAYMYGVAVNSSGRFVTVGSQISGNYAVAAYSSNGTTWTTLALMAGLSTSGYIRAVTVNSSGLFVAVGYDPAPLYATSTNGITWTAPARMNGSATTARMVGVTVNSSGLFVAVGYNSSSNPLFATSTDGSTWTTPARMNGDTGNNSMNAVTVNSSGRFVAVGQAGGVAVAAYSDNGSTWTTPASMNGYATFSIMNAVTVNSSGRFVAVGYSNGYNEGWAMTAYSDNGSTWSTPAKMNASTVVATMNGIAVNNTTGVFVAVGYDAGVNNTGYLKAPVVASSTNGSTWTTPAYFNATNSVNVDIKAVAVNSRGKFAAVGNVNAGTPVPMYAASWDIAFTPIRPPGSRLYSFTTCTTSSWVAPSGVTKVSLVAVGSGTSAGNTGYGGGLGYKNNYTVIPGCSYSTKVSGATLNSYSFFVSSAVVAGKYGGGATGGTYVGDGGGNGGVQGSAGYSGGGGAGGYSGAGGAGASVLNGAASTGGGGGGGGAGSANGGGGGVGLFGAGANGSGGAGSANAAGGGGGSGGCNGTNGSYYPGGCEYVHTCCTACYLVHYCSCSRGGCGGSYGGGGGHGVNVYGSGARGAVRIVWPGNTRTFPSTCVSTP